jgi:hypothetical protein
MPVMSANITSTSALASEGYAYDTIISDRETRFVNLLPRLFDASIQCELFCKHLGRGYAEARPPQFVQKFNQAFPRRVGLATPKYEALSYVWGSPDALKTTILLNGKNFEVGENLGNALRHLRLLDKPRTLWIYAMCID